MTLPDGGPAFPFVVQDCSKFQCHDAGMSLRDYFAGQALAGLMADPNCFNDVPKGATEEIFIAKIAYGFADAMLAERTQS